MAYVWFGLCKDRVLRGLSIVWFVKGSGPPWPKYSLVCVRIGSHVA